MKKYLAAIGVLLLPFAPHTQASSEEVKWSGYLNLVGGMLRDKPVSDSTTDKQYPGYAAYENRFTAAQDSLFALQASKSLNDKLSVTGQLVARGGAQDSFVTKIEWAYLSYQIDDNSSLRAGRLRQPTFYYSDFVDVGTAYTWVTPPLDVYSFNINYQGLNYLRRDTLAGVDLTTEIFGGAQDQNLSGITGPTAYAYERDIMGASFTVNYDEWLTPRSRAAAATVRLTVDYDIESLLIEQGLPEALAAPVADDVDRFIDPEYSKWEYVNLTVKTDFDRWFFIGEGMILRGYQELPFKQVRWYTSGGVRFGQFVYHLTYSRSEDDPGVAADYFENPLSVAVVQSFADAQSRNSESVILGMRIDTTRTTALKFDLIKFEEMASSTSETSGIGENMLLRAAFSASF